MQVPKTTFTKPREERLIEEAKERNRRRAEVSKNIQDTKRDTVFP